MQKTAKKKQAAQEVLLPVNLKKTLVYTVALDAKGSNVMRTQAKLLVMSLLRTRYPGKIMVFTNHHSPLFPTGRRNLTEVRVDDLGKTGKDLAEFACVLKFRASQWITKPEKFERILFLDCDCLVLRDLKPLFQCNGEVCWMAEKEPVKTWHGYRGYFTPQELRRLTGPGSNSGTWCVSGDVYENVCETMREIATDGYKQKDPFWGEQPAWNKLLHMRRFKTKCFPAGQIQLPMYVHTKYDDYCQAIVLHYAGTKALHKVQAMYGMYHGWFFGNLAPSLIDLWE